jgi:hypothetical protein
MPLSTLHTESGPPSGRSRISALGLAREHVPRRPPLHPFGRVVVSMLAIRGTSLIAASTLDFALDSNDGDAWDASWPWHKIGPATKEGTRHGPLGDCTGCVKQVVVEGNLIVDQRVVGANNFR